MVRDVSDGLAASPRQLPSKYFYDERGSQLFDEITRLDEYYPTRAERALLQQCAATIIDIARPKTVLELGAGSSDKTRVLLDAMATHGPHDATYLPVDVSYDFLAASAVQLRREYPELRVVPVAADFSTAFPVPPHPSPTLHVFLGSTIGNFTPEHAVSLLTGARARMCAGDFFLLGIDLRKDPDIIERAYNDASGITAAFNKNILQVINNTLGADFDQSAFNHDAIYNRADHRVEMRLVSRREQDVHIPDVGKLHLAVDESILTEFSYKYDRELASDILEQSGLTLREWLTDVARSFALALASC